MGPISEDLAPTRQRTTGRVSKRRCHAPGGDFFFWGGGAGGAGGRGGAGSGHGTLAKPAHQVVLENTLGIQNQRCPMRRLSHKAMWWHTEHVVRMSCI